MKYAFLKLHTSILLAGFTGIFGRLITLSEGVLVFYRLLLTTIIFFIILKAMGVFKSFPAKDLLRMGLLGALLAVHWIFFYGSVKAANVSVGVICFSLTGFFTAVFEPLLLKRRFMPKELLFSLIALLGVLLIFHLDTRYRTGIILGSIGAALAAVYTICNKLGCTKYPVSLLFFYQMAGGLLFMSFITPVYVYITGATVIPGMQNFVWLLLFAVFCTIIMNMLLINALKDISAFTVNLSYNLEPIYTIILAAIIFGEGQELNWSFYAGLGLIVLSVLLQMWSVLRNGAHLRLRRQ